MHRDDCGVFLETGQRLHPGELTEAKRAYLAALVERADLWEPRNGTAGLVFRDAGLPYDRKACRRLAAG